MVATNPWVLIVGAGPSGLLLALLLGQRGVPAQIVEKGRQIDAQPRATHYAPAAVHELQRAGIYEEAKAEGFVPNAVAWRKLGGEFIAGLSTDVYPVNYPDFNICLPLDKLCALLLKHLKQQPSVQIVYEHEVTEVGQSEQGAWMEVIMPTGQRRLHANFIVGCDGARSRVRHSLFGESFPGRTWDQQLVATNIYYPLETFGYTDVNFIIDPEHWHLAARISKDGLWRVTYGDAAGLSNTDLQDRLPAKFQSMLPGHPQPNSGDYIVASASPYRVHQRLAERMRVGKILLVADAAHLCNPFGGLGLSGGIVDAGGVADCLFGIFTGQADDDILTKYDQVRRQKYLDIVDPVSTESMLRLSNLNPSTALDDDQFLQSCKRAGTDPTFSRHFQRGLNSLMHDFTQYYHHKDDTVELAGQNR